MKPSEHVKYIGKLAATLLLTFTALSLIWYVTKLELTAGWGCVNYVYLLPLVVGGFVGESIAREYRNRIQEGRKTRNPVGETAEGVKKEG